MSAREKIAYLRGLIEGQNVTENASMTKFHEALLGALDSIAEELDDIGGSQDDLREYVEDLEDDLMELRSELGSELALGHCGHGDDSSEEEGEEEYEAMTCQLCGKDFFYRPDAYDEDEDLLCPHCGEPFEG